MAPRLGTIALVTLVLLAAANIPTAEAQLLGGSSPLPVPITGTVTGGGNFVGTLSIQRFAVQGTATVAVAAIAGSVVDAAGISVGSALRANISLPVTVNAVAPIAYRRGGSAFGGPGFMLVRQCGGAAQIQVGAGAIVDVMGTQVTLNPAVIDVGANTGGLLGSLVCQVLGLLGNPTMLVPVLNSLLAQLVGLVGGIGGGGLLL
jgi:hypothetical protein